MKLTTSERTLYFANALLLNKNNMLRSEHVNVLVLCNNIHK